MLAEARDRIDAALEELCELVTGQEFSGVSGGDVVFAYIHSSSVSLMRILNIFPGLFPMCVSTFLKKN